MFPLNLYARVRFLDAHFAHETAGAARTWSSLRPLIWEGGKLIAKLARMMRRDREAVFLNMPLFDKLSGCANALDRKSTRLNSSHIQKSRMPSSA